VTDLNQLVWAS